jgi:hypothetical protein
MSASRIDAILKANGNPPFPMNVKVWDTNSTVVEVQSVQDIVDLAAPGTRITIESSGTVLFPPPIPGRWHLPDTLKGAFPFQK